jgi:hypothetical protein
LRDGKIHTIRGDIDLNSICVAAGIGITVDQVKIVLEIMHNSLNE